MSIEWKESYTIYIDEIDEQHKKLINIGNQLFQVAMQPSEVFQYEKIRLAIDELKEYTIYHFEFEEALMLANNYQGYSEHKLEHDQFVKKIKSFEEDLVQYGSQDAILKMIEFLIVWISNHILIVDRRYSTDFLNRNIIGKSEENGFSA